MEAVATETQTTGRQQGSQHKGQSHYNDKAENARKKLEVDISPTKQELLELGRDKQHPNPVIKLISKVLGQVVGTPLTEPIEDIYDEEKADMAKLTFQNTFYPVKNTNTKNQLKNTLRSLVASWYASNNTGNKIVTTNKFLAQRIELLRQVIDFLESFDSEANKGKVEPLFEIIKKYNAKL
jgi:hypothetical protein